MHNCVQDLRLFMEPLAPAFRSEADLRTGHLQHHNLPSAGWQGWYSWVAGMQATETRHRLGHSNVGAKDIARPQTV